MNHKPIRNALVLLMTFVLSACGAYTLVHFNRLFPRQDQIIVYGRDTCGLTSLLRKDLDKRHIAYTYANIDATLIRSEMWQKIGPGFNGKKVILPVVHVGSKILISPQTEEIMKERARIGSNTVGQDGMPVAVHQSGRDFKTFLSGSHP